MWGKGGGGVIGVDIGLTLGGLIERRRLGGVGIRLVEGGVGLGRSRLAITRRLLASAQTLSVVAYEARLALRPVTATVCVCVRDKQQHTLTNCMNKWACSTARCPQAAPKGGSWAHSVTPGGPRWSPVIPG